MSVKQVLLDIDKIMLDGGTQSRAAMNAETIEDYAEALRGDPGALPAVVVFHDGTTYWLADGFHRIRAAQKIGQAQFQAMVHEGDLRTAILFSLGANASHGLRRNNADKRSVVTAMLEDDEWGKWSDREIARQTRTTHPFVAKVRSDLTGNVSSEKRVVTTKHGTTTVMNTTNIGTRPAIKPQSNIDRFLEADAYVEDTPSRTVDIVDAETGEITQLDPRAAHVSKFEAGDNVTFGERKGWILRIEDGKAYVAFAGNHEPTPIILELLTLDTQDDITAVMEVPAAVVETPAPAPQDAPISTPAVEAMPTPTLPELTLVQPAAPSVEALISLLTAAQDMALALLDTYPGRAYQLNSAIQQLTSTTKLVRAVGEPETIVKFAPPANQSLSRMPDAKPAGKALR